MMGWCLKDITLRQIDACFQAPALVPNHRGVLPKHPLPLQNYPSPLQDSEAEIQNSEA